MCEVLPENGPNLPPGSFAGSCFGCEVAEGELSCTNCKDGSGMSHSSSLSLSGCDNIGNSNGVLTCTERS